MTEQDIIEIKEMKNIGSMLNIITNLKSYHENINKTNKLVDIILPLCKTEPDYNSDLYDKNICDCDNFEYNDLVSNRQNKKKNIFKVPKLPADRGIIKYLNAIIYSVFLADYENMIIDHNKIFDAIQENLHLENKTIKEENTTLYESYNIDLKELKKKKKIVNKISEFNKILKKIKELVNSIEKQKKGFIKSNKRNNLQPNYYSSSSNLSNYCDEEDIWNYKCNEEGTKSLTKKKHKKKYVSTCVIASEYKKKCNK